MEIVMPFVTIEQIKPFVNDGLYNALIKNDVFTAIESEAAIFIRDNFSLTIPQSTNDAPDYIKRPAAMIIQKFARNKLQNITNEYLDVQESIVDKEYQWAIDYLSQQTSTNPNSNVGLIAGVDQW